MTQQGVCHWAQAVVPPARDHGAWQEDLRSAAPRSKSRATINCSKLELEKGWVFACALPCCLKEAITIISLPSAILAGQNREQKTFLCSCMCGGPTCIAFAGGKVSAHYHQQGSGWWPPLEHFPCRCKRNTLEWLKNYSLENVSEWLAILTANGPIFLIFFPLDMLVSPEHLTSRRIWSCSQVLAPAYTLSKPGLAHLS